MKLSIFVNDDFNQTRFMEINILAFGIAKDIIGGAVMKLEVAEKINAGELKSALEKKYEALAKLSSFLLAVNDEYAQPADLINPGDEVAIIPPVSGG